MPKIVWSQFKVMFKILFFDIRNNRCCNIYIHIYRVGKHQIKSAFFRPFLEDC